MNLNKNFDTNIVNILKTEDSTLAIHLNYEKNAVYVNLFARYTNTNIDSIMFVWNNNMKQEVVKYFDNINNFMDGEISIIEYEGNKVEIHIFWKQKNDNL